MIRKLQFRVDSNAQEFHMVWVIAVVQRDPNDKDSEFESFNFWVFLHNSDDSRDLVCTRL